MSVKTGKGIKTYYVSVVLGLRLGYSDEYLSIEDVKKAIETAAEEVDDFTFFGTLTPTTIFVRNGGKKYEEKGILIERSIYPRYPEDEESFKNKFAEFIGYLAELLKQERVCLRFTDESFMLETSHCQKPELD